MMERLFRILFALVALFVLVAEEGHFIGMYQVVKPAILLALIGYYLSTTKQGERSVVLLIALVFSWAGDVLLMFDGEIYFLLGLGAFLVSHLFYILTYRQFRGMEGEGFYGVQKIRFAFPIILAGTGLLAVLYPKLGDLTVPVSVYALVLVIMALAALFRFGYTSKSSFWMVFVGAILFMISDSCLAINKFLIPFNHSGLVIMSTYMSAQLLIVEGLLKHKAD